MPKFQALTDNYDGSGYSVIMPANATEWGEMFNDMFNYHWIDMNTRFVVIELEIFQDDAHFANSGLFFLRILSTGMSGSGKGNEKEHDSGWMKRFHFADMGGLLGSGRGSI